MTESPRKLFVSHAAADRPLVESFIRFLEAGVGVPPESIFCTSMPGSKITGGRNFREEIRQEVSNSVYVIALISPAFMESSFCWSELGAGWVLGERLKPFIVEPLDFSHVQKTVIGDLQCFKLDNADLSRFRNELSSMHLRNVPADVWETEKAAFLLRLSQFVDASPKNSQPIPKELAGKITVQGDSGSKTLSWLEVFQHVSATLASRRDDEVRIGFNVRCSQNSKKPFRISDTDWNEISIRLNLLGLVSTQKKRTVSGKYGTFWALTPKGRALFESE